MAQNVQFSISNSNTQGAFFAILKKQFSEKVAHIVVTITA